MTYTNTTTFTEARSRREIQRQLGRWNKDSWDCIGATDYPVPKAIGASEATVRFELRGVGITIACDSQLTYRQNLRCVAFAVEAMRMNEKRGIADTLAKAYLQLDAPIEARDPYEVLGVRPDAPMTTVEMVYRGLAKERHPDTGGSQEAMKELNDAYERIKSERNGV